MLWCVKNGFELEFAKYELPVSFIMCMLYQDVLENDIDGKVLSLEDKIKMGGNFKEKLAEYQKTLNIKN